MLKAYDRALEAWAKGKLAKLDDRIRGFIRGAKWDLHYGPLDAEAEEVEGWPGFEKACEEIRSALDDVRHLWIDLQCEDWTEEEPTEEDMDDDYVHVDRRALLRALLGSELAGHVR